MTTFYHLLILDFTLFTRALPSAEEYHFIIWNVTSLTYRHSY